MVPKGEDKKPVLRGIGNCYGSCNSSSGLMESRDHSSPVGGGYEELFQGSVPCPSCRGLGRVPKEQEDQLVALIPMKDQRLKPRRTLLYVGISIVVCGMIAGLLLFFLMPRDITLSSNRPLLMPISVIINSTGDAPFVNFTVVNHVNVTNENFYPVELTSVLMCGFWNNDPIGDATAYQKHNLKISSRSYKMIDIPIKLAYTRRKLVNDCVSTYDWDHDKWLRFDMTANYTYFGHTEQATLSILQRVSCYLPPTTTTAKPTTPTTTATTTTKQSTSITAKTLITLATTTSNTSTTTNKQSTPITAKTLRTLATTSSTTSTTINKQSTAIVSIKLRTLATTSATTNRTTTI